MHKRLGLLATLTVAALAATLAGCSGPAGAQGGSSSGSQVTLRYSIWDKDMQPAFQKIATAYEQENPGVKIQIELVPDSQYWTKLQTSAQAGDAPDLYWMSGPNFELYQGGGQLAPLDKAGTAELSHQPDTLVSLYTKDKTTYGIPFMYDAGALWYNKDIFDAAGLPYPDGTWTWDKFTQVAKQLTDPSKGIYGTMSEINDQTEIYPSIFQAGGYVISNDKKTSGYDTPAAKEALNFWVNLIKDGSSPTQAQLADTAPADYFTSGKIAMWWSSSNGVNLFRQALGDKASSINVAPLPHGKEKATVTHGLSVVVSAHSKHLKQAQAFQDYIGSAAAAKIFADAGNLSSYNGMQQGWLNANPQWNLQVFIDAMSYAKPFPTSYNTEVWQGKETELLGPAFDLKASVDTVAKSMADYMNQALAKEPKS